MLETYLLWSRYYLSSNWIDPSFFDLSTFADLARHNNSQPVSLPRCVSSFEAQEKEPPWKKILKWWLMHWIIGAWRYSRLFSTFLLFFPVLRALPPPLVQPPAVLFLAAWTSPILRRSQVWIFEVSRQTVALTFSRSRIPSDFFRSSFVSFIVPVSHFSRAISSCATYRRTRHPRIPS